MNIALNNFKGISPRTAPHLLASNVAQKALDTKLWSGELRPLNQDLLIKSLSRTTLPTELYLYKRQGGAEQWLTFDKDVDFVESPIADNLTRRVIISGLDDQLRAFDSNTLLSTKDTITVADTVVLGIERPAVAPTLGTASDTTDVVESRTYAISYVRTWPDGKRDVGTIGDPAKRADGTVVVDVNSTTNVTISGIKKPTNLDSKITSIVLWRSATTSKGDTGYRYVVEFNVDGTSLPSGVTYDAPSSSFTVVDSVKTEKLGETLTSMTWSAPVSGLTGIVNVIPGVLAGFKGRTVYFSEPYQVHAWPSVYAVTVDDDIVGLGAFGSNLVVCTVARPYILTLQAPDSVVARPIHEHAPCLSKRSIVSVNGSVLYASVNGVVAIDTTAPVLATQTIITKDEWKDYAPESMRSYFYRGAYISFYNTPLKSGGILLDIFNTGQGTVELSMSSACSVIDDEEDALYLVYFDNQAKPTIWKFDSGSAQSRFYTWKSKLFTNDEGISTLSAAKVDFSDPLLEMEESSVVAVSVPFNGVQVNQYPMNGDNTDIFSTMYKKSTCTFNYYVDKDLKFSKVITNSKPFRLPSGFRGDSHEVEVISNRYISRIQLASSMGELY